MPDPQPFRAEPTQDLGGPWPTELNVADFRLPPNGDSVNCGRCGTNSGMTQVFGRTWLTRPRNSEWYYCTRSPDPRVHACIYLEGYQRCQTCQSWVRNLRGSDCITCVANYPHVCIECGRRHNIGDVPDEFHYTGLCISCFERTFLYCDTCDSYHQIDDENAHASIYSYGYRPSPIFLHTTLDQRPRLYLGWELEVEIKDNIYDNVLNTAGSYTRNLNLYLKEDGSLNYGFEIVSMPMTLNYFNEHSDAYKAFFKVLVRMGCRSYQTDTCGMHIHLSRKPFKSSLHLYKFMRMVYDNPQLTLTVSQRVRSLLDRWASLDKEDKQVLARKALKHPHRTSRNDYESAGKYVAVNTDNRSTVELRIFRGTLNFNSFCKNLQYAHSLFTYTRDSAVSKTNSEEYLAWLKLNANNYPNLSDFFSIGIPIETES